MCRDEACAQTLVSLLADGLEPSVWVGLTQEVQSFQYEGRYCV